MEFLLFRGFPIPIFQAKLVKGTRGEINFLFLKKVVVHNFIFFWNTKYSMHMVKIRNFPIKNPQKYLDSAGGNFPYGTIE